MAGAASSISGWVFAKLTDICGSVRLSSEHAPGLGLGTSSSGTGSQFEEESRCALNGPLSKTAIMSETANAQIAEPGMALLDVVNTA